MTTTRIKLNDSIHNIKIRWSGIARTINNLQSLLARLHEVRNSQGSQKQRVNYAALNGNTNEDLLLVPEDGINSINANISNTNTKKLILEKEHSESRVRRV